MFSIIELQTNNGSTAHIFNTAPTRDEAMSIYHTCLAAAAISSVEYHACVVMDEWGQYVARECYVHPIVEEIAEETEVV